ncbi:MAG: nuclear transport factor 2 family protein [Coriobacteriales bacterium]|nr:nuclear transport factor 2 family protein [Coriobacteriales bacterium]
MIDQWMQRYIAAWRSDDPEAVAALFADDSRYRTAPHRPPVEGRDAIVEWWVDQGDSKLDWTFEYEIVAVDGDVSIVQGRTHYPCEGDQAAKTYRNLWVIEFASDGRAREFTEWYMLEPHTDGGES